MKSGLLPDRVAHVQTIRRSSTRGVLMYRHLQFDCALGRSGITARKREGDGASPQGTFEISQVYYRADRLSRPQTELPVRAMTEMDAWCDVPGDPNYNRLVKLPYPVIDERLWRDDGLYDIVCVLDFNVAPRIQGAGSAIFMHVARPGYLPTAGCVALALCDLQRFLDVVPGPRAVRFG